LFRQKLDYVEGELKVHGKQLTEIKEHLIISGSIGSNVLSKDKETQPKEAAKE
jgi:hypothetical protein